MNGRIAKMNTTEPQLPARDAFLKIMLTKNAKVMMEVTYEMKKIQIRNGLLLVNNGRSEKMFVVARTRMTVKDVESVMKVRMNQDVQKRLQDMPMIFMDSTRRDSRSMETFWVVEKKFKF